MAHSPETRKKISEGMRRANRKQEVKENRRKGLRKHALEKLASLDPESITHKKCSKCEVFKLIGEFSIRRVKLKCGLTAVYPEASCKACKNARNRENYEKRCAEGVQSEIEKRNRAKLTAEQKARKREMQRQYETTRRREAGIPPRNFKNRPPEREAVAVEPISVLIEVLEEQGMSRREISVQSGVLERRLYDIRHHTTPATSIDNVDRLLLTFGMQDAFEDLYPLETPERLVAYHHLDPKGLLKSANG